MRKTGKNINCLYCGKLFYIPQWRINNGGKYCSKACLYASQRGNVKNTGENNPNYGNGHPEGHKRITKYGYIEIKDSNFINTSNKYDKFVLEHRKIMSEYLNRPLKEYEHVHHINYIKTDNFLDNLYLCSSISEHTKITSSLHKLVNILLTKNILYFNKEDGKYYINENYL